MDQDQWIERASALPATAGRRRRARRSGPCVNESRETRALRLLEYGSHRALGKLRRNLAGLIMAPSS